MSTPTAVWPIRLCADFDTAQVIENACLIWREGILIYAGCVDASPIELEHCLVIAGGNRLATPALIDCHTHAVFAGHRADEFEARLSGASYADIAKRGGGIANSVRMTQAASESELYLQSKPRLRALIADGVATVEIKSGYGLTLDDEAKQLRVAKQLAEDLGLSVRKTYLALHTLPAFCSDANSRHDWIETVCRQWLPELHQRGLIDAVDAFCEHIAFTRSEVQRLFEAATALQIPVKLHAEQLSDQAGAALVASFHGLSADHLEYLSTASIQAMKSADTVAVLLPAAFYCLRETKLPPIAALRDAGVKMAVATDCNPGTSPVTSLRMCLHQACTLFGLTVREALLGATLQAARALRLDDRGRLAAGLRADFTLWDLQHPAEIVYWLGPVPNHVYAAGRLIS